MTRHNQIALGTFIMLVVLSIIGFALAVWPSGPKPRFDPDFVEGTAIEIEGAAHVLSYRQHKSLLAHLNQAPPAKAFGKPLAEKVLIYRFSSEPEILYLYDNGYKYRGVIYYAKDLPQWIEAFKQL